MANPSPPLAFCIVAFQAVVIDTGAAALLLAFRGATALPIIVDYLVPSGAVVPFQPMLETNRLPQVAALVNLAAQWHCRYRPTTRRCPCRQQSSLDEPWGGGAMSVIVEHGGMKQTAGRTRLHSLTSLPRLAPVSSFPGVRCRVLVCFHARQRRQPLTPPALTAWPQSTCPRVRVSSSVVSACLTPSCAINTRVWCMTRKISRSFPPERPAAAAKEVGMGNPAEERPPPSIISVPKLVLVVKPLARLGVVTTGGWDGPHPPRVGFPDERARWKVLGCISVRSF